jgi:hypothetical protein
VKSLLSASETDFRDFGNLQSFYHLIPKSHNNPSMLQLQLDNIDTSNSTQTLPNFALFWDVKDLHALI